MKLIQQWMVRFLRRRGWIVFWLDEPIQDKGCNEHFCWLLQYQLEMKRLNHD